MVDKRGNCFVSNNPVKQLWSRMLLMEHFSCLSALCFLMSPEVFFWGDKRRCNMASHTCYEVCCVSNKIWPFCCLANSEMLIVARLKFLDLVAKMII